MKTIEQIEKDAELKIIDQRFKQFTNDGEGRHPTDQEWEEIQILLARKNKLKHENT